LVEEVVDIRSQIHLPQDNHLKKVLRQHLALLERLGAAAAQIQAPVLRAQLEVLVVVHLEVLKFLVVVVMREDIRQWKVMLVEQLVPEVLLVVVEEGE
jgi:cell shape-determining protein MreD